jgi:hypothetical protein
MKSTNFNLKAMNNYQVENSARNGCDAHLELMRSLDNEEVQHAFGNGQMFDGRYVNLNSDNRQVSICITSGLKSWSFYHHQNKFN